MAKVRRVLKRLQPCASWVAQANRSIRIPEVVVYMEVNFGGEDFRTNCDVDYVGELFNGKIKSIVVVSGTWEFYKDAGFKKGREDRNGFRFILETGYYDYTDLIVICPNLTVKGISSYRCINP